MTTLVELTLCILGNFMPLLSSVEFFQNKLFQKYFQESNTIRVSNSLDPNQYLHSVGLDLGQNCLQRSLAYIYIFKASI